MEKGGGRRDSISGVPESREIRERHSGDILGRVREGGRSDNSDNKYAGFTNYGARLGRRPAHEKSGALREQDFAHKFARSNTFVSRARRDERIEALGAVRGGGRCVEARTHRARTGMEERETKREAGVAERVNSCVVVSYLGRATSSSDHRLPLCPFSLPFALPAATLHRRTARFKYQRRLKSDLYHAESCYLYRLIRDLPVRYFEGTPLLAPVLTEALTSFGTKDPGHRDPNDRVRGGVENMHPSLAVRPPARWESCRSFATQPRTTLSPFQRREREKEKSCSLLRRRPLSVIIVTLHLHAPPRVERDPTDRPSILCPFVVPSAPFKLPSSKRST